jgi:hypothetical protein
MMTDQDERLFLDREPSQDEKRAFMEENERGLDEAARRHLYATARSLDEHLPPVYPETASLFEEDVVGVVLLLYRAGGKISIEAAGMLPQPATRLLLQKASAEMDSQKETGQGRVQ